MNGDNSVVFIYKATRNKDCNQIETHHFAGAVAAEVQASILAWASDPGCSLACITQVSSDAFWVDGPTPAGPARVR